MNYNYSLSKQSKNILFFDKVDVYFIAFLNLFLIFGALLGGSSFFSSAYISIALTMNIAALATIIVIRPLPKDEILRKNKHIIISMLFELLLLLGLPIHLFTLYIPAKVIAVLAIQSFATIYFWKAFSNELEGIAAFLTFARTSFFQIASTKSSQIASRVSRIKLPIPIYHKVK